MFVFNNAFKLVLIGSTIYLVYKCNPKIISFSFFKPKPEENKVINLIDDKLANDNTSRLIKKLPIESKKVKDMLKKTIPNVKIEIKNGFNIKDYLFSNKNRKVKRPKWTKDQKLSDSIVYEIKLVEKNK